jgi:predicted acylesterase/phospholipase RssA
VIAQARCERMPNVERADVILSSGFLAFASHVGFLRALAESAVNIEAVVGTSSGALVGALYAAGHDTQRITSIITEAPPIAFLRPHGRFWKGVFGAGPLKAMLSRHLPATFEDLRWPLALGVCRVGDGAHELLTSGPLVEAVLASCAIPRLLQPVAVNGTWYMDGGAADRTAVDAWRRWRPGHRGLLHHVQRSRGREVTYSNDGLIEVSSPRSNNSLWQLREFPQQVEQTRIRTRDVLTTS